MKKRFLTVFVAMGISLLAGCATEGAAEPTAVPTQELKEEVMVTNVPEPTATPTQTVAPTAEPTATVTPQEILMPEPTVTPEPTATVTPTPTPMPTEIPHEHSYVESITTAETCDTDGVKTFTCACGASYTEKIKAGGHNYLTAESTKVEATCAKVGKQADKICSVCGEVIEGAEISKKSHSYGEYVYNDDATQEADGTKSRTCSVCGEVETQTAEGTKLPFDPYSLRVVESLDDIPVVELGSAEMQAAYLGMRRGDYEKIRYIASNGEQFCMWNVCMKNCYGEDKFVYQWYVAPIEGTFSDGWTYDEVVTQTAERADKQLIAVGSKMSSCINESMLNRDESIPLVHRIINSEACPVDLYEIVETEDMAYVWVEGTDCKQNGTGTCGSVQCTGECLRSKTLEAYNEIKSQKRWGHCAYGIGGQINWNGLLLVKYYTIPFDE